MSLIRPLALLSSFATDRQAFTNTYPLITNKFRTLLKCCGVEKEGTYGYKAWGSNSLFNSNKVPVVPNSCCTRSGGQIVDKAGCEMKVPKNGSIYLAGCYDATLHYARDHALIIGGVGIGISCLTVIGMIFACVLFKLIE